MKNAAYRRKTLEECIMDRAALVALLGMDPEIYTREGRYAATIGELEMWARQDGLIVNALAKP